MQAVLRRTALVASRASVRSAVASTSTLPPARRYQAFQACRHASSSSSSTTAQSTSTPTDGNEVNQRVQQPSTSPDKTDTPTTYPSGTAGDDVGSRDAATISQKGDTSGAGAALEADDGHTLMSEQEKEILEKLQKEFPGGTVGVQDVSGGCGTFFAISIASDKFKGLSKIKQHQKVNKVLADEVKTWHGMQLKTMAP